MRTATIQVPTADGPMAMYEAVPDAGPSRAVVVIQEAFGVNDHIEDVTRRFAAEGFHAVAPDLFHRVGGGVVAYEDLAGIRPKFEGLTDDAVLMDVDASIAQLHAAGFADGAIGVVGFCFGGRVSFLVSARRALGAGVGFYGGGITGPSMVAPTALAEEAGTLRTPWLGLFGDLDTGIPVEGVEKLRGALTRAPVDASIFRYPDAGHGFHCDARASYHEASARDGWRRTLGWFASHLS
jgi:carboxymethylenebutenolidase